MPWWFHVVESKHEFQNPTSAAKIRLLGQRLGLGPKSDLLDMASGRGGPAVLLAREFGCHVTCVERSEEFTIGTCFGSVRDPPGFHLGEWGRRAAPNLQGSADLRFYLAGCALRRTVEDARSGSRVQRVSGLGLAPSDRGPKIASDLRFLVAGAGFEPATPGYEFVREGFSSFLNVAYNIAFLLVDGRFRGSRSCRRLPSLFLLACPTRVQWHRRIIGAKTFENALRVALTK